jgi:hypothetical protein
MYRIAITLALAVLVAVFAVGHIQAGEFLAAVPYILGIFALTAVAYRQDTVLRRREARKGR